MRSLFKLSFKQLMLSNVFLGSRKENFYAFMRPFILGYRSSFCILNLFYTYIQFKLLINILINVLALRKKILIVKEEDLFNFKINFLELDLLYFYNRKWIGGCLTNFRIVSRHPKFAEFSESFPSLRYLKYLPSFLFLFDPDISAYALFEGYTLGILTSAIASSNCFYYESINYPIIGSTDCYESMYLYMYVLKDSLEYASLKEHVHVLSQNAAKHSRYIRKLIRRKLRIKKKKQLIKEALEKKRRKKKIEYRQKKKKRGINQLLVAEFREALLLQKFEVLRILKRIKILVSLQVKNFLIKAKALKIITRIKKLELFWKKKYIVYRSLRVRNNLRRERFRCLKLAKLKKNTRRRIKWKKGIYKFSERKKKRIIYKVVRRMRRLRMWRKRLIFSKLQRWQKWRVLLAFKRLRKIKRIKKFRKLRKKDKKWITTHVW